MPNFQIRPADDVDDEDDVVRCWRTEPKKDKTKKTQVKTTMATSKLIDTCRFKLKRGN